VPKKRLIMVAVTAAVLALVFTIPVFATGCDDDTAAYSDRMAGRMMERNDNADCQGNGTMCQGRGNSTDRDGTCEGTCKGTGACDGTCDGAGNGTGACDGAGNGTCEGGCANACNEAVCF
jgi:hypothetical protein